MKKVSCALIGPGRGPLVRVQSRGRLRVRSLPEGERAHMILLSAEREHRQVDVESNGDHEFSDCDSVVVHYSGTARGFIALVEIGEG